MPLQFSANYKEWRLRFETEAVYTRKDMAEALDKQRKAMVVNRVIQSFTGRVGPSESVAMQILAIHETTEGTLVIVR